MPRALVLTAVAALTACALPPGQKAPREPDPVSVSPGEVTALAAILSAEDRREADLAGLREHLRSASGLVRARAAVAVGRLQHEAGVAVLVPLLTDPDTAVAAAAAFALGQVGDTAAVPALAALLAPETDRNRPTVAGEAAYALGKLRSTESRDALRAFLASSPVAGPSSRLATRSALLAIWRFPRDREEEPIRRWLDSGDPELRWRATYALVRRPDPRATPLLPALLDDPDARVRALAARGLTAPLADSSGLGTPGARSHLERALDDPEYIVRISAIGALGTHRDVAAVTALLAPLGSGRPHEELAATESLGRLGEVAVAAAPILERRVGDEGLPVALRRAALDALDRIAPAAAERAATAAAASPHWRLRAGAAAPLAARGGPPIDALLRDPDGRVAASALQARVRQAGDSLAQLRPLLVEALRSRDAGVRTAALGALRRLADPATLPALLDAYAVASADPTGDDAPAAVEAIAALRGSGGDPARAFFARFPDPSHPLLHRLAVERFGVAAAEAWGAPGPVQTGRSIADYEALVRRWVVPEMEGSPRPTAVIETESGSLTLSLLAADAPLTVESFARLASSGFFDGQEWPRVVPNFVVQGGDPRGDMSGGPGYTIRDEISRHRYGTGTLGMALSGPDTGGSQFFITHSPQPHLDGIYAIFGALVAGREVAERILPGETILSIRIDP